MSFLPNDWNAIRAMYREAMPEILEAGANEWGHGAYFWDLGIIHFTPIETWLWHDIRTCDAVLYPQFPVGRYFVDFGNPVAKVAIECDGAQYHTDRAKDDARDRELEALGWSVYRFPGWMCKTDSDPETGKPGQAYEFMKRICQTHGIDRASREKSDEWESMEQCTTKALFRLFQREHAIRTAVERAAAGGRSNQGGAQC